MTTAITEPVNTPIEQTSWRIDPDRSSVEFEVATLWGLVTVAGRFESYDGSLALTRTPAIELTIHAESLDTNHAVRDEHLRSAEFFDVENHPYVRFVSDSATLSGQRLKASGWLHAAGRSMPLELEG
jgi:polyisoprenoid-binding protein YceI